MLSLTMMRVAVLLKPRQRWQVGGCVCVCVFKPRSVCAVGAVGAVGTHIADYCGDAVVWSDALGAALVRNAVSVSV